jgi:hypothetical protein
LNCSMRLLISSLISDGFSVVLDMVIDPEIECSFEESGHGWTVFALRETDFA